MKGTDSLLTYREAHERSEGSPAGLAGMKWVEWEKILTEERWCLRHQGKSKVTAHMSAVEAKRSDGAVLDK